MGERRLGSRYVLGESLGSGATGEVFHGRDADGVEYGVKVLHAALARDRGLVSRFVAERSALLDIDSPHVVQVHDLVAEGQTLAIVMEYVPGGNLRQLLTAGGPLPTTEVARLGAGVAAGLAAVHAAGVVHRDVKPENVLLDNRQHPARPLLTDFGISRLITAEQPDRTTGLIGTPYYLAPELIDGNPPTPACDLYALGILLYELTTGTPPFTGPLLSVLRDHAQTTPLRPGGMPEQLWSLITELLAKNPEQRIADATEVETRLRHLTTSPDPPRQPDPGPAARTDRPGADAPAVDLLAATVIPQPTQPPPAGTVDAPPEAARAGGRETVPRRRRRLLVPAAIAALIVTGGVVIAVQHASRDSGTSPASAADAAAINKLVKTVDVTADYVHVVCERSFTSDYVTRAYGTMKACRHSRDANPPGSNPTSVSVLDITSDGDAASAHVTEHGGGASGSTGTWYFRRSSGTWQVSDLGIDYVRSHFKLGFAQHKNRGPTDPFADPAYRTCFADKLLALPDDQFVAANSATQSGRSYVGRIVAPCDARAPGGSSPFRIEFNTVLRRDLAKDQPAVAGCVVNAMQTRISDADLTDALLDPPGSDAVSALEALDAAAVRDCSGGVPPAPSGP
jgi:hypothetical protein